MEITKESLEKEHLGLLKELFNYVSKEEDVADFETWADQNSIEKGNFMTLANTDSSSTSNSQTNKSTKSVQSNRNRSPKEMDLDEKEPTPPSPRAHTGAKVIKQVERQISEIESSIENLQPTGDAIDVDLTEKQNNEENESVKSIANIEDSAALKAKQDFGLNGLPRNYIRIFPAKVKKQAKSSKGYHLLASKLKIASKPLTRVIPTAKKAVSTLDWKVLLKFDVDGHR